MIKNLKLLLKMNHTVQYRAVFFIIILVSLCSCTGDNNPSYQLEVIDVASSVGRGSVVNISDVAHEIKYITLETTDSSLIGRNPSVYADSERIYVISMISADRYVSVFDIDGKYLYTFNRRGRGPQEYNSSRLTIDHTTSGFIAHEFSPKSSLLKEYDTEGNFKRSVKVPDLDSLTLTDVFKLNSNLYISAIRNASLSPVFYVHGAAFDSLSNILFRVPVSSFIQYPPLSIGELTLYHTSPPRIHLFGNSARLVNGGNDTIFSLDETLSYHPQFVINYGKYKNESREVFNMDINKGNHISLDPSFYMESSQFILLRFLMRDYAHEPYEVIVNSRDGIRNNVKTDCYGLYDKKSGVFIFVNHPIKGKPGIKDDINNGPPFIPGVASGREYSAAIYSADEIIEYAGTNEVKGDLKSVVMTLKDTDNPVVAIVRFK